MSHSPTTTIQQVRRSAQIKKCSVITEYGQVQLLKILEWAPISRYVTATLCTKYSPFPLRITLVCSPVAAVSSPPLPPRPRSAVERFMFIPVWNTGRPSLTLFRGLDHLNDMLVRLAFKRYQKGVHTKWA